MIFPLSQTRGDRAVEVTLAFGDDAGVISLITANKKRVPARNSFFD